jgi:hypothetical protein
MAVQDSRASLRGCVLINKNTLVHVLAIDPNGTKHYLVKPDSKRNERGELVLWPTWSNQLQNSKPLTYEMACAFRARMRSEHRNEVHLTLQAGSDQFIEERVPQETEDYSKRVPMSYRGLLAVPGFDGRTQTPCWYVRFAPHAIESVRGATPEEAVDRVYERNLQDKAEKAEPVAPEPEKPQKPAGRRMRPGDFKK